MKLSVVIPALNEEGAIRSIIERTLAARDTIVKKTPAEEVQVIVVSDGSSDRTPEIAREYVPQIKLISYRVNRGYGAAIKLGFRESDGDLVAFLDADGTCDPLFFVDLVNKLLDERADVAIGNRMTNGSSMPAVRRFGNRLFATLINVIAASHVSDSASGMRVIRRSRLDALYPLPDGLEFTPAMSCRAVLDRGLKIVEAPMSYAERTGKSKLSVFRDGLRFAAVIFDIALTYRPFRIFGSLGILLMAVMGLFGVDLVFGFLRTGKVPYDMIYRLLAIIVLGSAGLVAFSLGVLGERAVYLARLVTRPHRHFYLLLDQVISGNGLFWTGTCFVLGSVVLVLRPAWQYLTTGQIFVHWGQVGLAGFVFLFGFQMVALAGLNHIFSTLLVREIAARAKERDPADIVNG